MVRDYDFFSPLLHEPEGLQLLAWASFFAPFISSLFFSLFAVIRLKIKFNIARPAASLRRSLLPLEQSNAAYVCVLNAN